MTTLRSLIFLLYCYAAMMWFGLVYMPAVLFVDERFIWLSRQYNFQFNQLVARTAGKRYALAA